MKKTNKKVDASKPSTLETSEIITFCEPLMSNDSMAWNKNNSHTVSYYHGKLVPQALAFANNKYKTSKEWRDDFLSDLRKYKKVFTSYKDFCSFAKSLRDAKVAHTYCIKYNRQYLVCFTMDTAGNEKDVEFAYEFENSEISQLFGEMFGKKDLSPKDDTFNTSVKIFCDEQNYYQFIANPDIMELALTVQMNAHDGKPLYKEFKLTCKNGKVRDIIAPNDDIKPILQNINKTLQKVYDGRNKDFQVAYKPKMSIKNNAEKHINNQYVFKLDLHDFFPSCKASYVEKYTAFLFKNSIGNEVLKREFFKAIMKDDALYIGNPVSGTLANTIISSPVRYIKRICDKFGISFTVYADDMTFSSSKFLSKDFVIGIFSRAFTRYDMEKDFNLNEKKSFGVSKNNRSVTGVVINDDNKMTCHRYIYNDIRQTLHQLSYGDESHYSHQTLVGHIAFMMSIDTSGKLKNLVNKYEATIKKYGLISDDNIAKIKAA
jgi:RNA-directed DNA polymerase